MPAICTDTFTKHSMSHTSTVNLNVQKSTISSKNVSLWAQRFNGGLWNHHLKRIRHWALSPRSHAMAEYRHLKVFFIAFKTLWLPMYHLQLINTSTPAEQESVWFGYHSELNEKHWKSFFFLNQYVKVSHTKLYNRRTEQVEMQVKRETRQQQKDLWSRLFATACYSCLS